MRIRIFDDPGRLAEAAAQEIEAWVRLSSPGVTIGLAGGTTPRETYRRLRRISLPWNEVSAWMTDERFVPIDHPDSNAGMARRELFDHVAATLHPVPYLEGDPAGSAAAYQRELTGLLEASPTGLKPGLILLGVGEDGHTASLFPGTEAMMVEDRDFVAHWVPQQESWRLTATLPMLCRARRTMFLVTGERKAEVVADILGGGVDHPAGIVSRDSKDPVWLIDREAASLLDFG